MATPIPIFSFVMIAYALTSERQNREPLEPVSIAYPSYMRLVKSVPSARARVSYDAKLRKIVNDLIALDLEGGKSLN